MKLHEIEQQDLDRITKYFTGEAKPGEVEMVEQWRQQNPELFEKLQIIWDGTTVHQLRSQINTEMALLKVKQKQERINAHKPEHRSGKIIALVSKIAAALIVGVGLYTAALYLWPSDDFDLQVVDANPQKSETFYLPDGSVVTTNRNTVLKYAIGKDERKVHLEGEAYFEVAKDPKKPFVIETLSSRTKVLGTAFNLRALPGDKEDVIVVTEGTVAFAANKKRKSETLKLSVGQKAVVEKSTGEVKQVENDEPNYMAWKTGEYVFDNTSLSDIVVLLEKNYGVNIQIKNEDLAQQKITTTFRDKTIEEILNILALSTGAQLDCQNQTYELRK